jgi:hypothetical protein
MEDAGCRGYGPAADARGSRRTACGEWVGNGDVEVRNARRHASALIFKGEVSVGRQSFEVDERVE